MAASYATDADLLAIAPELSSVAVGLRDTIRSLAECWIGITFYGTKASQAHALLTAHMLTLHPSGLGANTPNGAQVSGMSDGPASASWAIPSTGDMDAWLAQSTYGTMLEALNGTLSYQSFAALARDMPHVPGGIA